jgi:hypothetical protein
MSGTKTLPMGPRYVDACIADFCTMRGNPVGATAEELVGFAFWWAREKGVSGWSKARLANEAGHMLADPDDIATKMEGQADG